MGYKFNPFTGTLDEVSAGGGGTPGGSDTQVQYNNAGSFGGSADLTWDDTAKELGVGGDINLDDGGTYTTTVQTVTPTANRTISFPDATGTVALVAGSNQAVQYNSAGANAGDSGLLYDATSGSLTVGGKTVTTDAPVINLSQTWNNAATTFTGLKLNVTNTASAAASNLLDLQVGGVSKARVSSAGRLDLSSSIKAFYVETSNVLLDFGGNFGISVSPAVGIGWGATGHASLRDVVLFRDAAGTLAQRNGANAQTFRLYNSYTDASNYERTSITRDSSSLVIDAQKDGTGADPTNLLDVKLDGVTKTYITTNGYLGIGSGLNPNNFIEHGLARNAGLALIGNNSQPSSNNTAYGALVRGTQVWLNGSGYLGWSTSLVAVTSPDVALARDSAGVIKVTDGSTGTGYIKQDPVAVSALPAAATVGAGTRGFVNDANATTFASVVAGGGANVVPVYSDGTDWRIG